MSFFFFLCFKFYFFEQKKESNTFADDDIDLASVLELYFSTCATSMTTDMLAVAGATLANAGTNPLTVKRVFSEETVQSILALMLSCGMNSESGKWAFDVGVPVRCYIISVLCAHVASASFRILTCIF